MNSDTPLTDVTVTGETTLWIDGHRRTVLVVQREFAKQLERALAERDKRIAGLEARIAAAEQDASRYRLVRLQSVSFEDEWSEHNGRVIRIVRSEEYLDKYVDEVLAQEVKADG